MSESLDGAMVEALGDKCALHRRGGSYASAYRTAIGRAAGPGAPDRPDRVLGLALDKLTHLHLIGVTMKMMRKPARLAGLGELQAFLERGYSAFGAMRGGASEFVTIVVAASGRSREALLRGRRRGAEPPQPRV